MHELYRITRVSVIQDYVIEVAFNDGLIRTIDLEPILTGVIYGPLRDPTLFRRVELDSEVHTIVWPNGADFDPETLHNWDRYEGELIERARKWAAARA